MAQYYEAIGRRKESTARVRLMDGSGKFVVNLVGHLLVFCFL